MTKAKDKKGKIYTWSYITPKHLKELIRLEGLEVI